MNNFAQRAATALIGGAVFVGAIIFSQYTFIALFVLIALLSLWEFFGMLKNSEAKPQWVMGFAIALFLITNAYLTAGLQKPMFWLLGIIFLPLMLIIELYRKHQTPFANVAYTLLGVIYVILPFVFLLMFPFSGKQYNWAIILAYFIVIWANDTGAYLVGVKFGKTKLFERISPKKSWEGTIGGIVISMGLASFFSIWFGTFSTIQWLIFAAVILPFAILGDLVESMFKRSINIKDSGNILPGHGGFLDRFDSVFLSAPAVAIFLLLVNTN